MDCLGLNERAPALVQDDDIGAAITNVTMVGNNTGVSRVFTHRVAKKYDVMYCQRAFLHWYVEEGMEEREFSEVKEDLGFLEKNYLNVLAERPTCLDDGSEDDY